MKRKPKPLTDADIAALKDGLRSPFWKALKKCIATEVEELERQIWNSEYGKMPDNILKNLIIERNATALFLDYPEKYISDKDPQPVVDGADDSDPYEDVKEDD